MRLDAESRRSIWALKSTHPAHAPHVIGGRPVPRVEMLQRSRAVQQAVQHAVDDEPGTVRRTVEEGERARAQQHGDPRQAEAIGLPGEEINALRASAPSFLSFGARPGRPSARLTPCWSGVRRLPRESEDDGLEEGRPRR